MKKYILSYVISLFGLPGVAQLAISEGASWVSNGNVTLTIQNMNLINNGDFHSGASSVKFTGNQNSMISGNSLPLFNILEIAKTNGVKVSLDRNININSAINFISGLIDLNGNNIVMNSFAMISGESENNRIIGAKGGFVEITQEMNVPLSTNAGNLGATISSNVNLGSVTIRRGHNSQSGTGLASSINRFYLVLPSNNSGLNATLRLKYFDAELNGQNENTLVLYKSNNSGTQWNNLSLSSRNTNANYVEKTGLGDMTLQTLANDYAQQSDGVTGLAFSGQRKKATEVTLKWTTQTETNMSGYQTQRRLKNETEFSDRVFINTLATGGNSVSALSYQNIDDNSYTDTSFYRLKMVTLNGNFTYSNVIAVPGKTKGGGGGNGNNSTRDGEITTTTRKQTSQINSSKKISVGPNPNNGDFWFSVNGIEKETIATLYTIDGKQVNQFRIVNLQQHHVSGLRSGMYILKIPGFETQKIIVNKRGNVNPNNQPKVADHSIL